MRLQMKGPRFALLVKVSHGGQAKVRESLSEFPDVLLANISALP